MTEENKGLNQFKDRLEKLAAFEQDEHDPDAHETLQDHYARDSEIKQNHTEKQRENLRNRDDEPNIFTTPQKNKAALDKHRADKERRFDLEDSQAPKEKPGNSRSSQLGKDNTLDA